MPEFHVITDVFILQHPKLGQYLTTTKHGLMTAELIGVRMQDNTIIPWNNVLSYREVQKVAKIVEEATKPAGKTPARRGRPKKRPARKD